MAYSRKTKAELLEELEALRARVKELEQDCTCPKETAEKRQNAYEQLRVAEEKLHQEDEELSAIRLETEKMRDWCRDLFEFIPDGYLVTDARGIIQEVNRVAEAMLNTPRQSLLGNPLTAFIAREQRSGFISHLSSFRNWVGQQKGELYIQPRGREQFPAEIVSARAGASSGTDKTILWLIRDITDRKQSEDQFRNRLTEIESIYNFAPIGLAFLDRSLRYIRINEHLAKINGLPASAHIGKTVHEVVPDLASLAEQIAEKIFQTRQPVLNVEFSGTTPAQPGAQRRWLEHWLPLKDSAGDVFGISVVVEEITERKQAALALQELNESLERRVAERTAELRITEERFVIAKEAANLGIHDFDVRSGMIRCDQRVRELWGVGPDEPITYEVFMSGLHPDDRGHTQAAVDRALDPSGDGKFFAEYRVINRETGAIRWIVASGQAFFEGGRPIRLVGTVEDITKRKQAEEALRASEERYRTLFESIDEGFCIIQVLFDENGKPVDYRFLDANPAFLSQTGLRDAVGRRMREMEPRHEQHWFDIYGRIAVTGKSERFTLEARYLDNRWYDVYAFRIGQPEERKVAVLFNDISERKRVEERLARERELLQKIFDNVPILFVLWDPRLERFTLNRRAETVFGWTTEEANEGDFLAKVYPDPAYRAEVAAYMESLEPGWREWIVTTKDGERIPTDWANIRLTDETMIGIGVDLRERKQAEQALRESEARLRNLSESLEETVRQKTAELLQAERLASIGQMVSTVAHEVRNPIQVIRTGVDALRLPVNEDERQELLDEVEYGANLLEGTVSDLLEYARPLILEFSFAPLREILEGALKLVSKKLKYINMSVELEQADIQLHVDSTKLQQALVNILSNAADAMPTGGSLTILSKTLEIADEKFLQISITDTGHGIHPNHLDEIFKPFFTTKTRGTGLGLALCKRIVDEHCGSIEIRSTLGQGTTVDMLLPVF